MKYFVSKHGSDQNSGCESSPFLTIKKAADIALPGDTITICEGTYRECVFPKHGGKNNEERIIYTAKKGDKVIIKGSEEVANWKNENGLWVSEIDNSVFTEINPFDTMLEGDWLRREYGKPFQHTGAVYINGQMLLEMLSKDELKDTDMSWFAEVLDTTTKVTANFGNLNPNENLIEVNARISCFAPKVNGIDYITISGIEFAHAATQWAPPTAEQQGAIWARWCKGWIIENNIVHHSRCSGISLGKDKEFGHNPSSVLQKKPGFRNQLEIVFKAVANGWSKEKIGSHIVRNNEIYHCGQTGIVGHMGGAFSEIYGNHIHHICHMLELNGHEMAGIKLHAAIDTCIHNNCIHDCCRGMWLDWQAQGVRVSSNVFFNNLKVDDLYVEVTHGPLLIDNNIFNSNIGIKNTAQGSAFINNWIGGEYVKCSESNRYTPYHMPHSTAPMGCSIIYSGDERIYNNIFVKKGTDCYNENPSSYEEYWEDIKKDIKTMAIDVQNFQNKKQPVYINNNVYAYEARPYEKEEKNIVLKDDVSLEIFEEADGYYAKLTIPELNLPCNIIQSHNLPVPRMTEEHYETPNGENISLDTDLTGEKRGITTIAGPIEKINKKVKIFSFPM